MIGDSRSWVVVTAAFMALVLVVMAGVWRYGYLQALDQLSRRGTADLTLVLNGLHSDLQRHRDQAVMLAEHPALTALTHTGDNTAQANETLLAAADRTAAAGLFYVDTAGRVLASSHDQAPDGLRDSPYFQRALDGALGTAYGHDSTSNRRLFYFAAPSFGADGKIQAALIALADVEDAETGWRGNQTSIFLADTQQRIFMSNRSELLQWMLPDGDTVLIEPGGKTRDFDVQQLGSHTIWQLDWGPYLPQNAMLLKRDLPRIGMTGFALVDVAPARKIAWLQALFIGAVLLFFGALLFLAQARRRALAEANMVLENRVTERTKALSQSNTALRHEIQERHDAEVALKQAQEDLVQAGKLSALGQMSAGISHELNQPLMAIQQFATNGEAFLERGKPQKAGENLSRISELAHRMGRIIRNLRAFARNENEPMGQVDIVNVVETALDLSGARLRNEGIQIDWQAPAHPIWVHGGEVRLGQVLVNLISNAADAMTDSDIKKLTIRVSAGSPVVVRVRDTGPGIEQPEKIFEPFYSTKAVGSSDGMGLGLSISYGLVQSFGGNIRGANTRDGAEFSVELEHWSQGEQAA